MALVNKFNSFTSDILRGVHNFTADANCTVKVALSNTVPLATNTILSQITEISYTNLVTTPGAAREILLGGTGVVNSGGTTATLGSDTIDITLAASGGAVASWRYMVLYNEVTVGALINPLIGWIDYGSVVTLNNGESVKMDFGASGILTIT